MEDSEAVLELLKNNQKDSPIQENALPNSKHQLVSESDDTESDHTENSEIGNNAILLNNGETFDSLANEKLFMSAIYHQSKLGVAVFDSNTSSLHLTQAWESESFDSIEILKFQLNPSVILTSSSMTPNFIENLRKSCDDDLPSFEVVATKLTDFGYDAAKSRLCSSISLPDFPENLTTKERNVLMSSVIDFDNIQMVQAAGGLVAYLIKYGIVGVVGNIDFKLNSVEHFSMENTLNMDVNSYQSLQIFNLDRHPSYLGMGHDKEGLSLFSLLNYTKTSPGKKLLRSWFMKPLTSSTEIEKRLDDVCFFVRPDNHALLEEVVGCLKHCRDVATILSRIRTVKASLTDWKYLFESFLYAIKLRELIRNFADELDLLHNLVEAISSEMEGIITTMNHVIDFEQTTKQHLVVKGGFDPDLDELKRVYEGFGDFLTEVGKQEMSRIPHLPWIKEMHIVYYPQIGCQIAIPIVPDLPIKEQLTVPDLKFQFRTATYIYFKNSRTDELDTYFGDIHNDILDRETGLIREIEKAILSLCKPILDAFGLISHLDCVVSFALAAKTHKLTRPTFTVENCLFINGGRHPLQENVVESFIPNDVSMCSEREGAVKLISGPNYSGKSVFLKQVGLICFMAHIGSYVSADSAKMSLCDTILTRIQSRETVSLAQSSFMIDCKQMSVILRRCTERSLVLIDEYGKGTNNLDGIALLTAIIKSLLARENGIPKTLITTHFSEIYPLLENSKNLELLTMDFMIPKDTDIEIEELIFLYKLVSGTATMSYGTVCAKKAGINQDIIDRAIEISEKISKHQQILPTNNPKYENDLKRYQDVVSIFKELDCDDTEAVAKFMTFLEKSSLQIEID